MYLYIPFKITFTLRLKSLLYACVYLVFDLNTET